MASREKVSAVDSKVVKAQRKAALERSLKPRVSKTATTKVAVKAVAPDAKGKQPAKAPLLLAQPEWVCSWEFERLERAAGAKLIAGVDEVGRGPLFGPVVAAAVILPAGVRLKGLNDSKQLCEADRERFDRRVRDIALAFAIAEVDVRTIDRINILQASRLAMRLAVEALKLRPDCLLIDGNQKIDYCPPGEICRQRTIVQGDGRSYSIAAASVIAKVHRDRLLTEMDALYPGYGLATNKGYSTPEHKAALLRLGITAMHRRSFAPVAELFEAEVDSVDIVDDLELELEFGLTGD